MKWWPVRPRKADQPAAVVAQPQLLRGPAHVLSDAVNTTSYVAADAETELSRLVRSIKEVDSYLESLGLQDPQYQDVFRTQNAILHDLTWLRKTTADITKGISAPEAVARSFADISGMFDAIPNTTLKERGTDVRSMARLVVSALAGVPLERREPNQPSVWIVEELDAATALQLRPETCLGVAATSDLVSGHGIAIATSRGFLCVTGRSDAEGIDEGATVEFD